MKRILFSLLCLAALGCRTQAATAPPVTSSTRIGIVDGKTFHTTGCPKLLGVSGTVTFNARGDALAAGYTADASGSCSP